MSFRTLTGPPRYRADEEVRGKRRAKEREGDKESGKWLGVARSTLNGFRRSKKSGFLSYFLVPEKIGNENGKCIDNQKSLLPATLLFAVFLARERNLLIGNVGF